jgi:hypothetical protein
MVDKIVNIATGAGKSLQQDHQAAKQRQQQQNIHQHHTHAQKGNTMLLLNYQYSILLMRLPPTLPRTGICLIAEELEMINYFGLEFSACLSNLIQTLTTFFFSTMMSLQDRITLILERKCSA